MEHNEAVIETEGLTKSFGSFEALCGVDLRVRRGDVHGFLGPNGAGKSTTLRVLLGLLRADGGRVSLLGGDPWRDVVALHRRLAYVPGDVSLWPSMSGGEAIDLLGKLRGGLDERRRAELLERFELDPSKRGRQYSKGNRQKVAIVAALSSHAELLLLDEPTSGLDPLMENVFQEELRRAVSEGATALLSSHLLSEVQSLADRVSIIRRGRVVMDGSLEELRGSARSTLHAQLGSVPPRSALSHLPDARLEGLRLSATVDSERVGDVLADLNAFGLHDVSVQPPSLESLFLSAYTEEEGGSAEAAS